MSGPSFTSWLGPCFERYVELRRACGADYTSRARRLATFDRYLAERRPDPPLTVDVVHDYFETMAHLSPLTRLDAVSIAWLALSYAHQHGEPVPPLPERPRIAAQRLRDPFVLTEEEIERLLGAALQLSPRSPFARATHATLLGLLYSTGLRIGEALALDVADFEARERLLRVRAGKFKKDRDLPLPDSTVVGLEAYLSRTDRPLERADRPLERAGSQPLFLSRERRRLSHRAALDALKRAARRGDVRDARGQLPRLHDLRYTFAAHRVAEWYRAGREVNALLPALSTYMGHVKVANTFVYLHAAEQLVGEGARRFEASVRELLDGRPA